MLALITIIAMLSMSHIGFLNRMIVRAELENLYNVCFSMQRRALMTGAIQTIQFDAAGKSYVAGASRYRLPVQVSFGAMPHAKGPPSSPSYAIEQPISFKENRIQFYPDGVISSGCVYLTDSSRSCSYALSCAVSAVSHLRKYQYTSGWQLLS